MWHDNGTTEAAVEGVVDICHQDPNNVAIVLMPQFHGGIDDVKLLKHSRQLEDRLMAHKLSMRYDASLTYEIQAEHAAEKRRLSQRVRICVSNAVGSNSVWFESAACRGRLGPVPLVRVKDMIIPGTSPAARARKLSPSARLCQRGVLACQQIIQEMMAGLKFEPGDKLLIVEAITQGIGEWGHAAWKIQQAGPSSPPLCAYLGICQDAEEREQMTSKLKGILMDEWWSSSSEAGPAALPTTSPACAFPLLKLCSWVSETPVIPESVENRFTGDIVQSAAWRDLVRKHRARYGIVADPSTPNAAMPPQPDLVSP